MASKTTGGGKKASYGGKVNPSANTPSTFKGGSKPPGSKGSLPTGAKAQARQALRQQTRKALRSGMPVKKSTKGLGITKNEGSAKLQKATKTLGYAKAEKVVQRTKARRTTKSGTYKPVKKGK